MPKNSSTSDLRVGSGVMVSILVPARILESHGDGTYGIDLLREPKVTGIVSRERIEPMTPSERDSFMPRPTISLPTNEDTRSPIRRLMDERSISRAALVKTLGYSPPKVDRLIVSNTIDLETALILVAEYGAELDPRCVNDADALKVGEAVRLLKMGKETEGE